MTSVDILHFMGAYLMIKVLCNRKNLTTMVYQWVGLYSSVNHTGEESNEQQQFMQVPIPVFLEFQLPVNMSKHG